MAYLSNSGRTKGIPHSTYRPAPILWAGKILRGPVVANDRGLADAAPTADIPWKTIGVLLALPLVFAVTGEK